MSDAADATLLRAEQEEFRRGQLYQELAETELARAECAILAGNLTAARVLAGSARTRFARRGNDRWRRVAELTLLSADLADGRPPTLLIGPAQRLAQEFRRRLGVASPDGGADRMRSLDRVGPAGTGGAIAL